MINQIESVTHTLLIMLVNTDPITGFRDFLEDFGRGLFWGFAFYFVFLPLIFLIAFIAFIAAAVSYSKAKQRMDKNINYYRSKLLKCTIVFLVVILVVVLFMFYLFLG